MSNLPGTAIGPVPRMCRRWVAGTALIGLLLAATAATAAEAAAPPLPGGQSSAAPDKLRFSEVAAGGQIQFSFVTGNHGDGNSFDGVGGVLAHAFFPPPTNSTPIAGDTHFDDAETWTTATRPAGGQPIDLVTVAAHEIGHAIGLRHSADTSALMFAFYGGSRRFLAQDDINGVRAKYGAP